MSLFTWNATYLMGVPEFDQHHQHLVELLNASFEAFEANTHPKQLEHLLDQLVDYATYHFTAEEQLMTACTYPEIVEHTGQHRSFCEKMSELQKEFSAGRTTLNADLFSFLADWFAVHILESDARYGVYLADWGGDETTRNDAIAELSRPHFETQTHKPTRETL